MARIGNRILPGRYTLGSWKMQEARDTQQELEHKVITTDRMTVIRCSYKAGSDFPSHFHPQEQITIVEEGTIVFEFEDREVVSVTAGQMIAIPAHVRHATRVPEGQARALNLFLAESRVAGQVRSFQGEQLPLAGVD
ncbi:MAG: cupin domain-containing protein [Candidatus Eisenbacteria bacterium]|uniref:Cupin domain-containing protein n=1 Tax=Eiseniibacteriota bacterium TaxID=2212470 RepID=A0A956RNE0_UNCEI|nr:cupin domain-containing protein [Candidatus Eisenbacteria bacterium]